MSEKLTVKIKLSWCDAKIVTSLFAYTRLLAVGQILLLSGYIDIFYFSR
jgi:hypothetical protein